MNDRLLKIQTELKTPKNQKNNFGGYNYRSCEDILEAVKPLLRQEKLILRLTDELVNIGERYYIKATAILTDGTDTIENTAYAREEETKKGMDGSQITGASSSYARKYALNGLFLIDDVKDSDATNIGEGFKTRADAEKYVVTFGKHEGLTLGEIESKDKGYFNYLLSKGDDTILSALSVMGYKQLSDEEAKEKMLLMQELSGILFERNIDSEEFCTKCNVGSTAELTIEQLNKAIKKLKGK